MIADFCELFDNNRELELDGYCEYTAEFNYINNFYENLPKKVYVYYINTNTGKYEFIFSKEFEIFDVKNVVKYEDPDDVIKEYFDDLKILGVRFFAVNTGDYLERKIIEKIENPNKLIFLLYDFTIVIDIKKRADNIELFIRNDRVIRPCEKENFLKNVVYNKRTVARPGSLEEKLYHYEDVSDKERELFYKNKKSESGGFTSAQKSR